ncbi:MAG: SH3 domain-containing protein [Acetobacteraceae bacterium]
MSRRITHTKGAVTGLPLPRFASLRADTVNVRRGPGTRYPIEWVFKRRHLPVIIVREFENWRLIRTMDRVEGWVHTALLTGRRSFIVGSKRVYLYRRPQPESRRVAALDPGVIGRFVHCAQNDSWCQAEAAGHRGYMLRSSVWGSEPGELVN